MKKAKQSTGKPYLNEMRVIEGKVMVWNGRKWILEQQFSKPQKQAHVY